MPWLSLVGMLFCTGAILFFAYWATKKIGTSGVGRFASGAQMRVWDRLSIGQNQALLMVQVGERWFVLATTRENVSKVVELSAEEAQLWQKPRSMLICSVSDNHQVQSVLGAFPYRLFLILCKGI